MRNRSATSILVLLAIVFGMSFLLHYRASNPQTASEGGNSTENKVVEPSGAPRELDKRAAIPTENTATSFSSEVSAPIPGPPPERISLSGYRDNFSRSKSRALGNSFPPSELNQGQEREIQSHTWVAGGFQPPNTQEFDELFRNQRKKTGFTYTELPILDGVYGGEFGSDAKSSQRFFITSLTQAVDNNRTGLNPNWLQWKGSIKTDLSGFISKFAGNEIYNGFIHLPADLFQSQGLDVSQCSEILVIRHFD